MRRENRPVWTVSLVAICMFNLGNAFIDPFTAIGVGGGAAIASYALPWVKCQFYECCSKKWIGFKPRDLEITLGEKLHGQHIVQDILTKVLGQHIGRQNSKKPLVISFHGFTGTGKNHVSRLIVQHTFKEGLKSSFVKTIVAPVHYPAHGDINSDKRRLISTIFSQVKLCKQSVFIFDEVDKMPPGLMDVVKPFMDYHANIDDVDFTMVTFILLSNTGGTAIAEKALEFWRQGRKREDITIHDLEDLIHQGAFNEPGGLFRSETIGKNVVDYYIPFLPLERDHIKLCAKDAFLDESVKPDEKMVSWVADKMEYVPKDSMTYSKSGCKRVAQKVALYLEQEHKEYYTNTK